MKQNVFFMFDGSNYNESEVKNFSFDDCERLAKEDSANVIRLTTEELVSKMNDDTIHNEDYWTTHFVA